MLNATRLIELLHEAKTRSKGAERDAFVEAECGDEAELKEQLVSLLTADAHEEGSDFLTGAHGLSLPRRAMEQPGDWIAQYKLLEQIGEGGCGIVYLAEQERPVRRRVALKVIKLGMDTKEVIGRFEAERQALAMMDHPNIAKVLDGGSTLGGRPYFVMELVSGDRITHHCDANKLSTRERLELFIQVCQAVQHAHQKGVIHRDIKPSNILVTRDGTLAVPKVIDFGIAKATTDQRLTDKTVFTALEQFLGTPAYMSPEAMMSSLDIDTRTDIYALGVLLYELLTGQTPFDAKDLMSISLEAMRHIIREQEPARPSTRLITLPASALTAVADQRRVEPRKLRGLLRGDLDWIVMKALEKDRSRRYETANGLAVDIQRHLSNEPIVARPPSTAYRVQKAWRRNKLAFSAGLAVAAALLLAMVALAVSRSRISHAQEKTANALLAEIRAKQDLEVDSYFHHITIAHRELLEDNLGGALQSLSECPKELRGWEWNYLQRLGRVDPVVLRSSKDIHSIAFHPAGGQIAAACRDGSLEIWDLATRKVVQRFVGHTKYAYSVAYRPPDGRFLASAGADQTIRVWDTLSGEQVFQRPGQAGEYRGMSYSVAFSTDGRRLMADRGDGVTAAWDADTGAELPALQDKHEIATTSVQCSPGGELVATGSWAGVLRIWDQRSGKLLHTLREHTHRISAMSFESGSGRLATGSFDRTLKVWDPATGTLLQSWTAHAGIISGVSFTPNGKRLASCGIEDKRVKLWDPITGREILNLRGHTSLCHAVAFSPDGQLLASASQDGTIRIWDGRPLRPNEAMESLTCEHESEVWSVAFSPDGTLVASGSWDNTVKLWDPKSGSLLRTLPHEGSVFHVTFSPDGGQLAVASLTADRAAAVTTWNPLTGEKLFVLHEKAFPFFVTFDPTGRYLLREGADFTVKVWDSQAREDVGIAGQHGFNIWCMKFSPDGRRLATASSDGSIKVWPWNPKELSHPVEPELTLPSRLLGYGDRVAFSPGGELVAGGEGNTVRIWQGDSEQAIKDLPGHKGEIWAVALDPRGRWLATAGEDTTIKIWDARSWQLLMTLRGHTGFIMSLAFSPDGKQLASGGRDHKVKIWDTVRWTELPGSEGFTKTDDGPK